MNFASSNASSRSSTRDRSRGRRARVGIAQPSLSQHIRSLEEELNGALIERLPRGIALTPAGRTLLPEARAAVRALDAAGRGARAALALEAGELEIATVLSMAVGLLPRYIRIWHERYPKVGDPPPGVPPSRAARGCGRAGRRGLRDRAGAGAAAGRARSRSAWEEFVIVVPPTIRSPGRRVPLEEPRTAMGALPPGSRARRDPRGDLPPRRVQPARPVEPRRPRALRGSRGRARPGARARQHRAARHRRRRAALPAQADPRRRRLLRGASWSPTRGRSSNVLRSTPRPRPKNALSIEL